MISTMVRRAQALASAVCIVSTIAVAQPTPPTIAALPPAAIKDRGARVPFIEYEAENAVMTGVIIGPDRRFTTIAAEASGRRAVRLDRPGRYVEFTLARPANAVTVRAAVPDSADGHGLDGNLSVLIDGRQSGQIAVTSRYGWFYGRYPFTNHPADGAPHHYFDETRFMFRRTLPTGTKVRLQVPNGPMSPWYVVDLADFELVPPPLRPPLQAVFVVDMGADPSGATCSRAAFEDAITRARAEHHPVWIPAGRYRVDGPLVVDNVTIRGAGPWYSVVQGERLGFYGRAAPQGSNDVRLQDFAIVGNVAARIDKDQDSGIGGAMSDSLIRNIFIQHEKVGLWFDGPMHDIRIERLRITDTTADGLNFHHGVSRALVVDTFVRNTGDDGLAAWSQSDADHDILFRHDTVVSPILANGIAVYGGRDVRMQHNLVADTVTEGGGLHIGNRFGAVPVAGTIEVADNEVVRGGSRDPHWGFGVGALWLYALDAPIAGSIRLEHNRLIDSTDTAVMFIGKRVDGVTIDRLDVDGAGGPAITIRSPGAASLSHSRAAGFRDGAIVRCSAGFMLRDSGGNTGFRTAGGDLHGLSKNDGTQACGEKSE